MEYLFKKSPNPLTTMVYKTDR